MIRIPGFISPAKPLVAAIAITCISTSHADGIDIGLGQGGGTELTIEPTYCASLIVDSTPANDTELTTTLDEAVTMYGTERETCGTAPIRITIADSLAGQVINSASTSILLNSSANLTIIGNPNNPPVLEAMGTDGQLLASTSTGSTLTLRNLIMKGNNPSAAQESRPISVIDSILNLENVRLHNFYSYGKGGALNATRSSVSIKDSVFENNKSFQNGGAIHFYGIEGDKLTIENSTFTGNGIAPSITHGSTTRGGAIAITGLTGEQLSITDNVFTGHHLTTGQNIEASLSIEGGAIYADGQSSLTLARNTFIDNHVISAYNYAGTAKGGAVFIDTPDVITDIVFGIVENTFQDNQALLDNTDAAQAFGGAVYMESFSLAGIINNTFIGNDSDQLGGAIAALPASQSGNLIVQQNTFSHNTSVQGGGAFYAYPEAPINVITVEHNTFVSNTASESGGAAIHLNNISAGAAITPLHHNVFAYNGAAEGSEAAIPVLCNSSTQDPVGLAYNFFDVPPSMDTCSDVSDLDNGGNQIGTVETPLNPQLNDLGLYGGPTFTYLPKPGSPLLNAGDPNFRTDVMFAPQADQRGKQRIFDGVIDLGAVERGNERAPIVSVPGTGEGILTGHGGSAGGAMLTLLSLLGLRRRKRQ